jgi:protein gp37
VEPDCQPLKWKSSKMIFVDSMSDLFHKAVRIAAEGWTLVAIYRDSAQSGASHLRPGYQKLLA